jgi:hypothetical protein
MDIEGWTEEAARTVEEEKIEEFSMTRTIRDLNAEAVRIVEAKKIEENVRDKKFKK